jgi:hypothetical protein
MEKREITAALRAKSPITIGPSDYLPYIWADRQDGEIRFSTDNPDCEIDDVMKDFLSPMRKKFSVSRFVLAFDKALHNGSLKMTDDFEISFKVPDSDNEQIADIIQFIQKCIFPGVKTWSVKPGQRLK